MAIKFQRNFELRVEYKDGETSRFQVITMPQTIEFSVAKAALLSLNEATLKVYNLNPETRARLRKDSWNNQQIRKVIFLAGYGSNLRTVFYGTIDSAQSYRQGSDFITELKCLDGGGGTIKGPYTGIFKKGQKKQELLDSVVNSIVANNVGITRGAIAKVEGEFQRDETFVGNALDLLWRITNNGVYLDNMRIFYLRDNQYIRSSIVELNASTGLLETPRIGDGQIEVTMLFEPSILVGQQLKVSSTQAIGSSTNLFSSDFRVIGLYHSGVISGAKNGTCTTTVVLSAFGSVAGKEEVIVEDTGAVSGG